MWENLTYVIGSQTLDKTHALTICLGDLQTHTLPFEKLRLTTFEYQIHKMIWNIQIITSSLPKTQDIKSPLGLGKANEDVYVSLFFS